VVANQPCLPPSLQNTDCTESDDPEGFLVGFVALNSAPKVNILFLHFSFSPKLGENIRKNSRFKSSDLAVNTDINTSQTPLI
jgi:hypothetical protein